MNKSDKDIVYGINPVREILKSTRSVEKVFFENSHMNKALFELLKDCKKQKIPYQVVAFQKLNSYAGTSKHQGVVAACGIKSYVPLEELLKAASDKNELPFLVVADSVEDPRNFGALIRTSLAAGVHGILLPKQGGAGLTPVVAKTSAGAIEEMLFTRSDNIADDLKELSQKGFEIAGLDAKAQLSYRKADFSVPLVIVVGGENRGIRPHIRRHCTKMYSIPINLVCNSLNLSVAAGIVLFEAVYQRNTINQ